MRMETAIRHGRSAMAAIQQTKIAREELRADFLLLSNAIVDEAARFVASAAKDR